MELPACVRVCVCLALKTAAYLGKTKGGNQDQCLNFYQARGWGGLVASSDVSSASRP